MKSKYIYLSIWISTLSLLFTACQLSASTEPDFESEIATIVALTLTASPQDIEPTAALPTPTLPAITPEPTVVDTDFQALNDQACQALMESMSQILGTSVEIAQIQIERSQAQDSGTACQLSAAFDGQHLSGSITIGNMLADMLVDQGWSGGVFGELGGECLGAGGWGPGAVTSCFTLEDKICQPFVYLEPINDQICETLPQDRSCLEQLAPDQKLYTAQLTCSQGLELPEISLPAESELQRIRFQPDETSAQVLGTLAPGSIAHFVLRAEGGQELTTIIDPADAVWVSIFSEDGAELKSDFNDQPEWSGTLPATQDYYIDLKSIVDTNTDYSLEVIIPPLEPDTTPGEIAGWIGYPGDTPRLHILAFNIETTYWYYIITSPNTTYYSMTGLPPGKYHVAAYSQHGQVSGYLTAGGQLSTVTILPDETTENIDLSSWYNPGAISLPADPVGW
ncbi:MAG: hypothetical protein IMY76_09050 [Chloroflexi bacterium]|nr:hypothetical protein [Chloroflexota bacterium]